jgi:hypothetical protein
MADILNFPTEEENIAQVFQTASKIKFSEIMIIGFEKGSEDLVTVTSKMTKRDVLWMLEASKLTLMLD